MGKNFEFWIFRDILGLSMDGATGLNFGDPGISGDYPRMALLDHTMEIQGYPGIVHGCTTGADL